jgi:localization factor PodJL
VRGAGIAHANGDGGPKDHVQAYKWFALSAAQGDEQAAAHRDWLEKKMTPAQLAQAKRLVAEWKRKNAGGGAAKN